MSYERPNPALMPVKLCASLDTNATRHLNMDLTDILWHIANFIAPAFLTGALSAIATKLLWRRELQHVPLRILFVFASCGAVVALVGGLLIFKRDGTMAAYSAMVALCALMLWWRGFGPGRS